MRPNKRKYHLSTLRKSDLTCDISSTDEELRSVVAHERSVTTTLILGQGVDLGLKLVVDLHGLRLAEDLTTDDLLHDRRRPEHTSSLLIPRRRIPTLSPAIPWSRDLWNISTPKGQEHRRGHTGAGSRKSLLDTADLEVVTNLDSTSLNSAGDDGTTTTNGVDIFNGEQEVLVDLSLGLHT